MSRLPFHVQKTASGSQARAGKLQLRAGYDDPRTGAQSSVNEIQTPIFMPVATLGTVRAQQTETLSESGSKILLSNTYHQIMRPGLDVLEKFGGLHAFMKWNGSILTDSGGYQIFSLPHHREMTEDAACFRSSVDGTKIVLSPEESIRAQKIIGSNIMMVLDQCIDSTSSRDDAARAMELTHRWAIRSLDARTRLEEGHLAPEARSAMAAKSSALFGIVQGACFEDLRRESAEFLRTLPFDGIAIGGLAVGESRELREQMTGATTRHMPEHLPRYLMGVGTPIDLLEAVHRGVDMFDCILPTAFAQMGMAFSSRGRVVLRRGIYRVQNGPIDPECGCPTCAKHDRGYLHHLIKSREILGWSLVGQHNLYFYHRLMSRIRAAILDDTFLEFYRHWRGILAADDFDNPIVKQKPSGKKRPKPPKELGDYRILETPTHASIQQISSGEIMHAQSDPTDESHRLYVEQTKIVEKAAAAARPYIVWDVGLGAGANAMAVVRAIEAKLAEGRAGAPIEMEIWSFENDLNSLRLALNHPKLFSYLKHAGPYTLIEEREWRAKDGSLAWKLLEGDFLQTMERAPDPDVVLYDPFSNKVDSPLWTEETFRRIRARGERKPIEWVTYSSSTAVRGRLLSAGFYVARGCATPPKVETTIATSHRVEGYDYLGREWIERWKRSGARIPALDAAIEGHRQFVAAVAEQV